MTCAGTVTRTRAPTADSLDLGRGDVHVWRIDLDRDPEAGRSLESTLGYDERVSARGFRRPRDRQRFVHAHGATRCILARYLGAEPAEVEFQRNERGKPKLRHGSLQFSLSHSEDLAMCAVSRTCCIGIDTERIREQIASEVTASLSPLARQVLGSFPESERRNGFFRGWTRLEAVVKAGGCDLDQGLGHAEVFLDPGRPAIVLQEIAPERSGKLWLFELSPRRGYVASLASSEAYATVTLRRWRALGHATRRLSPNGSGEGRLAPCCES